MGLFSLSSRQAFLWRILLILTVFFVPVDLFAQPSLSDPGGGGVIQNSPSPAGGGNAAANDPLVRPHTPLFLLQPPDDATNQLAPEPGINIFFTYFNLAWPWILGIAAGLAVLQIMVAGVQIMYAGGPERAEEGKTRLMWAVAGLLLIGLAGFILRLLNPLFYV